MTFGGVQLESGARDGSHLADKLDQHMTVEQNYKKA